MQSQRMNGRGEAVFPDSDNTRLASNIENILKPLSNSTRQSILLLLADGPITYSEILSELSLESGSFYWHIKKMNTLVNQTELKEYYLSELGQRAIQLLTLQDGPIIHPSNINSDPVWFTKLSAFTGKIGNAPLWVQLQQFIIGMGVLWYFFFQADLVQFGTFVFHLKASVSYVIVTLLATVLMISLFLLLIVYSNFRLYAKSNTGISDYLAHWLRLSLFTLPLAFPGLFIGIFSVSFGIEFVDNLMVQFVLSFFFLYLAVILSAAYLNDTFQLGFKDSLLFTLICYYPMVLLSFLFVQLF